MWVVPSIAAAGSIPPTRDLPGTRSFFGQRGSNHDRALGATHTVTVQISLPQTPVRQRANAVGALPLLRGREQR